MICWRLESTESGTHAVENRHLQRERGQRPAASTGLEWLAETAPDIVCLQELKTDDSKVPARAIEDAGYGAIWHGQRAHHGVAILAKGEAPKERRRGLPGDLEDKQSRYLEAEVKGLVVASVYLPNGNPQPGPKFESKLAWFQRLITHAAELLRTGGAGRIGRRPQRRAHQISTFTTRGRGGSMP